MTPEGRRLYDLPPRCSQTTDLMRTTDMKEFLLPPQRLRFAGLPAIACCSLAVSVAHADEVSLQNQGFESNTFRGCPNPCATSCGLTVEGWTRLGSSIQTDLVRNVVDSCGPFNPTGGSYYISLQGSVCCEGCNNNGGIRKEVALDAGVNYILSMDVLLDEYDQLRISMGDIEIDLLPEQARLYEWTTVQLPFTCSKPADAIEIRSVSPLGDQPACLEADYASIDNIHIDFAPSCPGDFDGDGAVTGVDLGTWLSFIDAGCSPGSACPGDLDGDGEVRGSDLGLLLLNWGICD